MNVQRLKIDEHRDSVSVVFWNKSNLSNAGWMKGERVFLFTRGFKIEYCFVSIKGAMIICYK